ncbi:MAG: tRNA-specific adenosine deaminase [Verrucomicrobia bacterium]|nr:MAG: tRNA-specific adenosine deaminase [Verrucomicrobiota bacterium]
MSKNHKEIQDCPFQKIYPSELHKDDTYFMKMAYNEAIEAWKSDEVPIGAVIVYKGSIIGRSHNAVETQKDPTAHAEILAITQAARIIGDWRLNDAEMYVTKEPCPMCSGAAIMSRLKRIIYAFEDPKMGCLGGAFSLNELQGLNHRLTITKGVLEQECKELLQSFFLKKRSNVD